MMHITSLMSIIVQGCYTSRPKCARASAMYNRRHGFLDIYYSARSYAPAEYWKHFTARFDGVHAFGYIFAESKPIWMKSGAL